MFRYRGLRSPDIRSVPVFIYALREPNGPIRYVGRTSNPKIRLQAHYSGGTPPMKRWLSGLRARGERPVLLILDTVPPGQGSEPVERKFIDGIQRLAGGLLNIMGTGARRHCRFCGSQDHDGGSSLRWCRKQRAA